MKREDRFYWVTWANGNTVIAEWVSEEAQWYFFGDENGYDDDFVEKSELGPCVQRDSDLVKQRDELVEKAALMCALSNAVSMSFRSPDGRSRVWIETKVRALYEVQCDMEDLLRRIEAAKSGVTR